MHLNMHPVLECEWRISYFVCLVGHGPKKELSSVTIDTYMNVSYILGIKLRNSTELNAVSLVKTTKEFDWSVQWT